MKSTVVYCDGDLLVCEKPRGLLSEGEGEQALPTYLNEYLREMGRKENVLCVHRLDRQTSGLMVYALHRTSAAELSRQIAQGGLEKEYLAVLCGRPAEKEGSLTDLLFFDRAKNRSFVVDRERKGVKRAELRYRLLEERAGASLVRIRLLTGRTHQIRVQFSSRGLPLRGDRRYGAPAEGFEMRLHSCALSLTHPRTGEALRFTSLPEWEEWPLDGLEEL